MYLKFPIALCILLVPVIPLQAQEENQDQEQVRPAKKTISGKSKTGASGVAQPNADQEDQPVSLKIVIADEPKTIDPASKVPAPLARKVSVEMDEMSIREVVDWLRKESGMTVLVDEADLLDANILLSEPVTDRLDNQPLYLLLDRLQSIALGWYVEDEILHITTRERALEHLTTVPHNVGSFFDRGFDPDKLTNAIIYGTDSERWEEMGGLGTLVLLGDVLFIRQSDEMHRQVTGLLKAMDKQGRRTFIDDPSEHQALRTRLAEKVSVDFRDTPLSEAIRELVKQTRADIRIDIASFRESRIREREPVSLKLSNQKLSSVLQALVAKLRLTWTLRNGSILVTTRETADSLLKTAVFDVRDLSRNEDESASLQDAIRMQTVGQWEMDGGIGAISFAKPGVMIVRQTEKTQGEVLAVLETYRQALKISKARNRNRIDPLEKITEYYRLPTVIANDLEKLLPSLVDAQSWKSESNPLGIGTIVKVASTPSLLNANSNVVQKKVKEQLKVEGGLVVENSVLIIYQTRETHDRIRDLIFKVENGNIAQGKAGIGFGGGAGGGGFGGGFFSARQPGGVRTEKSTARTRSGK
ncbi:MAG: hypothetical protein VX768_08960 [Planctomycetota bacterium]|nr:hypothetical protein [Planctomycetota bacterium]